MGTRGTILVVDDEEDTRELVAQMLRRRGYDAQPLPSARACLQHLETHGVDVVLTDVQMPDMTGVKLCAELRDRHPDLLSIVVTGLSTLDTAIEAIRAGAYDFITKPVRTDIIETALDRALEHLATKREVRRLLALNSSTPIPGIVGKSAVLRRMLDLVRRVALSDASVLITGESGTGKELIARAIHDLSGGRDSFIAINCAAVPANLLESELFGHVRGAFTDAKTSRAGIFAQAGAGTVFLDEIGEMPMEMQSKLLRVVQERKVRPVGSDEEIPFQARLITATNRDLEFEVEEGRFREDLYYRINVVEIATPPLRDRIGDVMVIVDHVLDRITARTQKPKLAVTPAAARKLIDYNWPGNVRELENAIERAVALARESIDVAHLPTKVIDHTPTRIEISTTTAGELLPWAEVERRYVQHVVEALDGNKTRAARVLGIDRRSLYRRLASPAVATPQ